MVVSQHIVFLIAASAFVFAALSEYLCRRTGRALGVRLFTWAAGAVFIFVLPHLASFEQMCSVLDRASNCDEQIYASLLSVFAVQSVMLWSALYPVAATVCGLIYRHMLTRPRANL